jgi:hypothetical protein
MAAPSTRDEKLVPASFEFSRKKSKAKYTAVQFAEKVQTLGTRGKSKDKIIVKRDVSKFVALTEREIDSLLAEYEIDVKLAKVLGANLILRQKAAGGGMIDVVISWLRRDKIVIPDVTDPEKIASGYRSIASTILGIYRDKVRMGKKTATIEKCYTAFFDED